MKKLTAIAIAPLFAGFLFAQSEQSAQREKTETTVTETTWNGTLVDAGCRTTHTSHRESSETSKVDENTTRTTKTTTDSHRTECPATITSTTFGIMTSDGKYIPFDEASNTKVVEVMKSNRSWRGSAESRKPVTVTVIGNQRGDTIYIRSIK